MRNLKKVLSLALALVMLVGMMVVGAGAVETKFVDDGKIGDSYKEAVAVMSAIKVLGGKENNNFDPQGTLTRAEAAKILCVMTMGSDAAEGLASVTKSGVFTDMPDHWAAGYVDACYNKGIVLGMAQGIYGPSNTLTGTQFAAMLLRAMGVEGEFTGPSWESAVIAAAGKAKLSEVTTKPIAREAASKMAFDGLLYSPSGEKAYKVGNLTFDNFLEAYIAADQDVEKITVSTASDSLATTVFGLAEDAKTDAFGNPVKVWVYDDEDVVTLPGAAATLTFTKKMSASDLDKYTYADDAKLFVDGKEKALKGTNDANDAAVVAESGNGTEVNVYATNKVISKVVAVKDYVDTVSAVTPARGDKDRTITVGSLTYKTEEFEKGDVVLYTKAYNAESKKYEIKTVEMAETVENVKVTSAKLDGDNHVVSFSVDGEDYDFSAVSVPVNKDDANLNNIVTLYLDSHGFVGKVEKVEGTSSDAYVLDIGYKNAVYGSDATYYAKLLLTDGTVVSQAEIAKATVDANKGGQTSAANISTALGTALKSKIVSFTEVDDVYTLTAKSAALNNYVTTSGPNNGKVEINNGKSAMTLGDGTLYANSNTIFLVKTGNSYASYTGFDEVPNLKNTTTDATKNGKFAYSATSSVVSVIYLEGVQSETSDVVFLLGAGCDTSATKDSNGTYYNCKAVVNGEITSVKLNSKLDKDTNKLLNSVVQDKNGIIDVGASTDVDDVVASKNVTKALEGGVITIDSTPYVVAEDSIAYVCGTDIQGSDVGAIVKGDTVIFAVIKDGQITTVFYTEKPTTADSGENNNNNDTNTGDIYVDVSALGNIGVYTTKASLTTPEGVEAVLAKLKAEKYTIPADGEDGAPEIDGSGDLVGKVIKNGIKYNFKWDVSTTTANGVAIKLDNKDIIVASGAKVSTVAGGTAGDANPSEYVRYHNKDVTTWKYLANNDNTDTVSTGMTIETGWYKVTVNGAAAAAATLDMTGVETYSANTYVLGTAIPKKGTGSKGTGFKVGTTYYAWENLTKTFADLDANGTVAIIADQVKLTIVNETVGSEGTTTVPQAYAASTSKQDLSSVTGITGTGTHMYVGDAATAQTLATTVDVSDDVTVRVGYVTVGTLTDTALGHTISRTYDNKAATAGTVLKVGSKLNVTVTIAAGGTALDAGDTIAFGTSATVKSYPGTGLTTTGGTQAAGDVSNGTLTIPTSTTAVSGSISAEYTVTNSQFTEGVTISHS